MENLFNRLNPELKKTLKNNEKKYPASVASVIDNLKSKVIHGDLTIGELRDLAIWSDVSMDDFDWKFGENIFKQL